MDTVDTAYDELMKLDWSHLQRLMFAASEGHARMCIAASEEEDPHASKEVMQIRIADMGKEDLARALAPFAALGALVHEHHAEHGQH